MAVVTKGKTFGATETVTNTKLHDLVDDATVTSIVNADISAGADIDASKLDLSSSGYLTTGANATITGTYTYDTAPVLPADTIDAITEIKSTLKSGADGTLITGTAGIDGNVAMFNADGDIVDGGSTPVATTAQLSAWVVFDGTDTNPITKGAGYNIDGTITKNGTGDYTINWDTNFASSAYCVTFGSDYVDGGAFDQYEISVETKAAGSLRIRSRNGADSADNPDINIMAIGAQ